MLQHAREEYGAAREEVRQRRRLAPCRAGSVLGGGSGPVTRARALRARVGPASFVASNVWSYAPIGIALSLNVCGRFSPQRDRVTDGVASELLVALPRSDEGAPGRAGARPPTHDPPVEL